MKPIFIQLTNSETGKMFVININHIIRIDTKENPIKVQPFIETVNNKGYIEIEEHPQEVEQLIQKTLNVKNAITFDDLEDLKVLIVGNLVIEGLIKDCTDTDDDTEFEAQDIVFNTLKSKLEQLGKL